MPPHNYRHPFRECEYYHIFARTINREPLFANDENRYYFLSKWGLYFANYLDTHACCLMGSHFHFVVKVKIFDEAILKKVAEENTNAALAFLKKEVTTDEFLEDQFKRLLNGYAKAFNAQQKRRGSLFQKSFCRVLLPDEWAVRNAICYVHHNPIHHLGLAGYNDWEYSSYQLLAAYPNITTTLFGNIFIDYHEQYKLHYAQRNTEEDEY